MSSSVASSAGDAYDGTFSRTSKTSPRAPSLSFAQRPAKSSGERTRKAAQIDGLSDAQRNGSGRGGSNPDSPVIASTLSNAGSVRWGSRKTRQSSWVPTKKCAEVLLFPLAKPWNSGNLKHCSMPARYSVTLKDSRPRRRQTSKMTAPAPWANFSRTKDLKMAPSSKATQATPLRKEGASVPSQASPLASESQRWPTTRAADVGPNQAEGSLPSRRCPPWTKLCKEKGAFGTSKKQEIISLYAEPSARSRAA
mmetsp:Transcript_92746/g.300058  ORF Transcript_92746/g.300058 Transcript_92746/m.300058 type:complete len:252 (-) Transcript_92746:338-1093(-)